MRIQSILSRGQGHTDHFTEQHECQSRVPTRESPPPVTGHAQGHRRAGSRSGTPPCRAPRVSTRLPIFTRLPSAHAVGAWPRPLTERERALRGHRFFPTAGRNGGTRILLPVRQAVATATSLPIGAGPGQAPSSPAPRGWTGPEGGAAGQARPAVSLRGRPAGGLADARRLPLRSLARSRALPLAACGEVRAAPAAPPLPRPDRLLAPLLAKFLPPAHPA